MDVFLGILIIGILGLFAICSYFISSECNKYEDFHRKSDEEDECRRKNATKK